ncbi:Cell division protein FtsI [Peptidoglycan synthetase] [Brevinematales bacterium NS]|nr:penicillin-binding protein 2 [Brevinematales bacterium]QJR21151.1 Cell division protein FtsI [Peptidoglycan synthetase] [Brevinematales bacterium NS]
MVNKRATLVILGFLLAFVLLFYRIMTLVLWPEVKTSGTEGTFTQRGIIYDRYTNALTLNVEYYDFYIRPARLSEETRQWLITHLVGMEGKVFSLQDMSVLESTKDFVYLKRRLPYSQKNRLETILTNYPGKWPSDSWGFLKKNSRYYGFLETAKVVGYVNIDNEGLAGLEFFFDERLKKGENLYTTLDPLVSRIALEELIRGITEASAEYGSVIVMKISNREILAMVDWPSYDPNVYTTISERNSINYALSVAYEPGSVMKVFASTFALQEKLVRQDESFFCGGSIEIYQTKIKDGFAHGNLRLAEIIQKSCNVGMVQVADRFTATRWYHTLTNLGFGKTPAIPLPGKAKGILRSLSEWSGLSKYMTSIGQEIGVSTLQLALALGTLADHGWYESPTLVYEGKEKERHQVLDSTACETILHMMEKVVGENGTALSARIEGLTIAGKTGTGQIAKENGQGYYPNFFSALFMGVFPAEKPEYLMVVAVNRIHGPKHTGGEIAAPIFSRIVRRMIIQTDYFGGKP